MNLDAFLHAIPAIATSPFALVGYLVLVAAWLLLAFRVRRNKHLLNHLHKIPPEQRLAALQAEMGNVAPPNDITPEQWLSSRIHTYYFWGFLALCFCVTLMALAAYFSTKGSTFRVAYYRMSGIAPRLLVRGLLADEWQRMLGAPTRIVQNTVLAEANKFLERFAEPLDGSYLHGDFPQLGRLASASTPTIQDYAKLLKGSRQVPTRQQEQLRHLWTAYLGGAGGGWTFMPDIPSANIIVNSAQWPAGFKIYYPSSYAMYIEEHERRGGVRQYAPPTAWRYLRSTDISNYYTNIEAIRTDVFRKAGLNVPDTPLKKDKKIESIRYLIANGFPEDYMVVQASSDTHGGWSFTSEIRDFELEVAVLENVSSAPLDIGTFGLREVVGAKIRNLEDTESQLKAAKPQHRILYPVRVLAPGEKILIPVRIHFNSRFGSDPLEHGLLTKLIDRIKAEKSEIIALRHAFEGSILYSKTKMSLLNHEPPRSPKSVDFGPAWVLDSVYINNQSQKVRRADWKNFAVFLSSMEGSCPFVYTWQPDTGVWINEGTVLTGATSREKSGKYYIQLHHFNGRLQIREREAEVTILRNAVLYITDASGNSRQYNAANFARGVDVVLENGDYVDLSFDGLENDLTGKSATLMVDGYYIPYSSAVIKAAGR